MNGNDLMERSYANAPQCSAASKQTGNRCKNYAIRGGTVCKFHGGGSAVVRRKAALRLAALVDPAIATLGREMVKAEKSSDRIRAAAEVLDRGGFGRHATVTNVDEARDRLLYMLRAIRASGAPDAHDAGELEP